MPPARLTTSENPSERISSTALALRPPILQWMTYESLCDSSESRSGSSPSGMSRACSMLLISCSNASLTSIRTVSDPPFEE